MFFNKKNKNESDSFDLVKIAALLIHAAKIDEKYSIEEEEIIKKTLLNLGTNQNELETIIKEAKQREKNTSWCLFGCAVGDFGTILYFQITQIPFPVLGIMILAIINGLITSIILETIILIKQDLDFSKAFKTAMGMSFISMISMEITMNLTDYFLTGGAILTWWVIPIMLIVGFLTPWPYNYWRLKKFGINCH